MNNTDSYFQQLEVSKKEFFCNSSKLMKECINIFEKNSVITVRVIIETARNNDLEELTKQVHKLKGMLCLFPFFDAFFTCSDLEKCLLHSPLDVSSKIVFLEEKVKFVQETLHNYKETYLT